MGELQHENVLLKVPVNVHLIGDMSPKMSEKTEKVSDKMSEKMSDKNKTRLVTVLNYLQTVESISSSQTADLLKIEIKAANRLLVKAVELGILEAQGSNKTRKYSVKNSK
jgi:predicted HTH transcriptional regulator